MLVHLRLVALLGRQVWLLVPILVLGLGVSALLLGQAVITAEIFALLFTPTVDVAVMTTPLLVLAGIVIARPLVVMAREVVTVAVMTAVKTRMRRRICVRVVQRGPIAAGQERSGDLQSVLVDGVENLDPYWSKYVPQLGITAITTVAAVAVLLWVDPVVAIAVGVVAVIVPLIPRLWDKVLTARGSDHWTAYATLHSDVVDNIQAMTTLKSVSAHHRQRDQLAAASDELLVKTLAQLRIALLESGLSAVALVGGPVIALVVAILRIESGDLAASEVFLVTLVSIELFRPFKELSGHWHAGYLGVFAGEKVRTLLAAPIDPDPVLSTRPPQGPVGVQVSNLSHTYPGATSPALAGICWQVEPGEQIAVVGRSGSGKSTLAALLTRMMLPTEGTVRLGGQTTAELSRTDCVRTVGLVAQNPVLFHGTLRDNLHQAAPRASETELIEVVDLTGLDQLAEDGTPTSALDRPVGERGGLLSGGQRQRVALARIILRNPQVLVLDEATSALDPASEHAMLATLRDRHPGLTVIIVAHRLAALTEVDRITVLDQGRIIEEGDHHSLLDRGGSYAAMVTEQADLVGAHS